MFFLFHFILFLFLFFFYFFFIFYFLLLFYFILFYFFYPVQGPWVTLVAPGLACSCMASISIYCHNNNKRDMGPVVTCCNLLPRSINTRLNILPGSTRNGNNNNNIIIIIINNCLHKKDDILNENPYL